MDYQYDNLIAHFYYLTLQLWGQKGSTFGSKQLAMLCDKLPRQHYENEQQCGGEAFVEYLATVFL